MSNGIDVFHLFPELAAIGQSKLQVYCNEWLRRPIARQYGVAQLIVDDQLLLSVHVAASEPIQDGDWMVMPIDQLLGYIVDRHFADAQQRRGLQARIRETRQRWGEFHRDYAVTVGRKGTLFLTCKNPRCRAELETAHEGIEGQTITCPATDVTCPFCGVTSKYEGRDLHWRAD